MKEIRGRSVLVTGAAGGIGKATAIEFAREGADPLILNDINKEGLEDTADKAAAYGGRVVVLPADVSDYDVVKEMVEKALDEASTRGIGVTCICPGGVKTAIYDDSPFKGFSEEAREKAKEFLLSTAEEPEDTARTIVSAVKSNKFLVVTTPVAKAVYFVRRHFPLLWFPLTKAISRWFVKNFDKYRTQ